VSLEKCDRCDAYQSVRWIDLRTGELTGDFSHASQLCLDCQADVRERTNPYPVL
jgi:hypothetical protein